MLFRSLRQVAPGLEYPVAVMVDQRLRGDEREHGLGHAVHARAPLFRDVIRVAAADKRDDVPLPVTKRKKAPLESRESHKETPLAADPADSH